MQHDIKTASQMIALAKKAREIRIWVGWGECHMKAVKSQFIAELVMNQELGREELGSELWADLDDQGILWVD